MITRVCLRRPSILSTCVKWHPARHSNSFIMGITRPLFRLFSLFQPTKQTIQFYQNVNVKNDYPVYGAGILTQVVSRNHKRRAPAPTFVDNFYRSNSVGTVPKFYGIGGRQEERKKRLKMTWAQSYQENFPRKIMLQWFGALWLVVNVWAANRKA